VTCALAQVGIFGKASGKKVIGCMSFGLNELIKDKQGVVVTGWYRLLDEAKGQRAVSCVLRDTVLFRGSDVPNVCCGACEPRVGWHRTARLTSLTHS
jgi:hypothetical protein